MSSDTTVVKLDAEIDAFRRKMTEAGRISREFGNATSAGSAVGALGFSGVATVAGVLGTGIAALGVTAGATAFKIVDVAKSFESLKASLVTVTGSTASADKAFGKLQAFAAKTPFDLEQVVKGFIKLKAMGLEPSERALTSYGNTAGAMGKSLNDMVEAVADAAVGEFERLKEFGIKASAQGDKIAFTFAGVRTVVKKDSDAIQDYLLQLGETKFAGGMDRQAQTIAGTLSNLGDAFDQLIANFGQKSGIVDLLKESFRGLGDMVNFAAEQMRDKTPLEEMTAELGKLTLRQMELDKTLKINGSGRSAEQFRKDRDAVTAKIQATNEQIKVLQKQAEVEAAATTAKEAADKKAADTAKTQAAADEAAAKAAEEAAKARKQLNEVGLNAIASMQREVELNGTLTELEKTRYEITKGALKDIAAPQKEKILDLAKEADALERIKTLKEKRDRSVDDVDSTRERLDKTGTTREDNRYAEEFTKMNDARANGVINLQEYQEIEAALVAEHQDRLAAIRENADQVQRDRIANLFDFYNASELERADLVKNAEQAIQNFRSMSAANQANIVTGGLAQMTSALANHSRAFFNINKAAGIANAVVNTAQGVTEALKLPFPANLVAAATVAANGAAQIMTIKSAQFGSSGSSASVNGSAPRSPSDQGGVTGGAPGKIPDAKPIAISLTLRDEEVISGEGLRKLIRRINEEAADMGINAYTLAA